MSRPPRIQEPHQFYHVYNRGNNRQQIFNFPSDYRLFLNLIKRYKKKFAIKIYYYVLMPNHIHFLLEPTRDLTLSAFIQGLTLAHTRRYNDHYQRVGHLWQGRFSSKLIECDAYLVQCGEYIEANPVRAGLVSKPEDYPWSSAAGHINGAWDEILDPLPEECRPDLTPKIRVG